MLIRKLAAALNHLDKIADEADGAPADAIAQAIYDAGYRIPIGLDTTCDPNTCALAWYLTQRTGYTCRASSDFARIYGTDPDVPPAEVITRVAHYPVNVSAFVEQFDIHTYDALYRPGPTPTT
jgi:hypothetical protein